MPSFARHLYPVDRRAFLVAGGLSYFGVNLAGPAMALAESGTARGEATGSGRPASPRPTPRASAGSMRSTHCRFLRFSLHSRS